jgi:hypothetical protein
MSEVARPQDLLMAYDSDFVGYTSFGRMAQPVEAIYGAPGGVWGGGENDYDTPDGYYEDFTARLGRFVRENPHLGLAQPAAAPERAQFGTESADDSAVSTRKLSVNGGAFQILSLVRDTTDDTGSTQFLLWDHVRDSFDSKHVPEVAGGAPFSLGDHVRGCDSCGDGNWGGAPGASYSGERLDYRSDDYDSADSDEEVYGGWELSGDEYAPDETSEEDVSYGDRGSFLQGALGGGLETDYGAGVYRLGGASVHQEHPAALSILDEVVDV